MAFSLPPEIYMEVAVRKGIDCTLFITNALPGYLHSGMYSQKREVKEKINLDRDGAKEEIR